MSKYSIAKEALAQAYSRGEEDGLEQVDVVEAVIVTAIQDLIKGHGAAGARSFLRYELDSVSSDGFHDIQKR